MHVPVSIRTNRNMLSWAIDTVGTQDSRNCTKWCAKFSYDACAIFNICMRSDWPLCKINTASFSKSWWCMHQKLKEKRAKNAVTQAAKPEKRTIYFQGYLVVGRLLLLARYYSLTSQQHFISLNNFVFFFCCWDSVSRGSSTGLKIEVCLPPSPLTLKHFAEIWDVPTKLQRGSPLKCKLSFDFCINLNNS